MPGDEVNSNSRPVVWSPSNQACRGEGGGERGDSLHTDDTWQMTIVKKIVSGVSGITQVHAKSLSRRVTRFVSEDYRRDCIVKVNM